MPDTVAKAARRKYALDLARTALRSGTHSDLETALGELPEDGRKAARLRIELTAALEGTRERTTSSIRSAGVRASCTSDGVRYEFHLAETDDIALFRPRRIGSNVTVTVNTMHPFGRQLLANDSWLNPAVLSLLAAWAHYELDQSDERRQSAVRDARIDWGRVVRRILSADNGFRIE